MFIKINQDYPLNDKFIKEPIAYFKKYGENIKAGTTIYDENGKIKDDPNAVKNIKTLNIVGKHININKGQVLKSGYIFYEAIIISYAQACGLHGPNLIGIARNYDYNLFFTEKINGIRGNNLEEQLLPTAMRLCEELRIQYEKKGLIRKFKMKDMIFDIQNNQIIKIIPTDFERTKLDEQKLDKILWNKIVNEFEQYFNN